MLDTLVPRFRPGVRWARRDDGSSVVFDPDAGTYVEIASDQTGLLALVDGQRSSAEIAAEHLLEHRFVPFQALGDLLATLRGRGLLANPAGDLDAASVPAPPKALRARALASFRMARVRLPGLGAASIAVLLATASLAAVALGFSFSQSPFWPFDLRLDPLRPSGSPFWGLLSAVLGGLVAVHARAFVRAGLAASMGWPPAALELRLRLVLPVLEPEPGPVQLLPRRPRLLVHLAALLAPWATALCWLVLLPGEPLAASAALGAAVAGYVDACPFAPTSMGQLLAALAGRVDLRDHARSYLSRRFLSRLGSGFFDGEKAILATASLAALWAAAGLEQLLRHGPRTLVGLYAAGRQPSGVDSAAGWVGVVLVGAGCAAGFFFLAQTVLVALGSVVPARWRARPARVGGGRPLSEAGDAEQLLARIPLFAGLSAEVRREIAREAGRVEFAAGSVVFRKGDPGDRFYALLEGRVAVEREHESGLRRVVAVLGPGDCFGEVSLLGRVPRTATVRAEGPVAALALDRDGFERLVHALPGTDLTRLIRASAALHRSPLFRGMPSERISMLLPRLGQKEVEAGALVVRRGEPGALFYLVDEGELEVLDERDEGKVARLSAGDHFGEVALLRDVPRTATVRAKGPARLFSLTKRDLFEVLGRDLVFSGSMEEAARERMKGGR